MRMLLRRCALAAVCLSLTAAARADVTLPKIFGSNMVLQQDQAVKVWGWAEAGEKVRIGLFFQDESLPRYEETRHVPTVTAEQKIAAINEELDRHGV